jgi:hypothetical protein
MRIRSFIIAYALVLAILLFADRRPGSTQQDRYSHVVDLTDGAKRRSRASARNPEPASLLPVPHSRDLDRRPDSAGAPRRPAGGYGFERLGTGYRFDGSAQISLDDIAAWESQHGMIPQGAVVAIRRVGPPRQFAGFKRRSVIRRTLTPLPIARDAAMFLIEARYTIGFAVETPVNLTSDRTLAQQLALHGNYVVEGAHASPRCLRPGRSSSSPRQKNKKPGERSGPHPGHGEIVFLLGLFSLHRTFIQNHLPMRRKFMSDPRYPIGKFSYSGPLTAEQKQQCLTDIEQTPGPLARRAQRTV